MKKNFLSRSLCVSALATCLLGAANARAADVIVVHGINGSDLGLAEALPVDVAVNGGCALRDFQFGDITNEPPISLPAGPYEIEVRLSDGDCAGTLVATADVNIAFGETAIIVAHLDQAGTISITNFTANAAELRKDATRVSVAHAATAPEVSISLRGADKYRGDTSDVRNHYRRLGSRASVYGLANGGSSFPAELLAGDYEVRIGFGSGLKSVFNSIRLRDVPLEGNLVIVAVGTLSEGTFAPLIVQVP
jgi:hypothetical protein